MKGKSKYNFYSAVPRPLQMTCTRAMSRLVLDRAKSDTARVRYIHKLNGLVNMCAMTKGKGKERERENDETRNKLSRTVRNNGDDNSIEFTRFWSTDSEIRVCVWTEIPVARLFCFYGNARANGVDDVTSSSLVPVVILYYYIINLCRVRVSSVRYYVSRKYTYIILCFV